MSSEPEESKNEKQQEKKTVKKEDDQVLKHPYSIIIKPQSKFHFSFNDQMLSEVYEPTNTENVRLSDLFVEFSVFLRSMASGQFTAQKLVQTSDTTYVFFVTSSGQLITKPRPNDEDSDEEIDLDPAPNAPNAVQQRQDRLKVIESSDATPILSFEYVSWETVLEICCAPDRQPFADLLENTVLLVYPVLLKQQKKAKSACECQSHLCCCKTQASSQLQLFQKVAQLMFPDPSITLKEYGNIRTRLRGWRDGALDFTCRWLQRYPDDCTSDLIQIFLLLWKRVGEFEEAQLDYQEVAGNFQFDIQNKSDLPNCVLRQLGKIEQLILETQNQINSSSKIDQQVQESGENKMLTIQSNCLSLLFFSDQGRTPDYFNMDKITCRDVLERRRMNQYFSRINFSMRLDKQLKSKELDQNMDMFLTLLTNQPMDFALLIAHYFTESYLMISPRDVQKMAMGNDPQTVTQLIQRHNALGKLLQIMLFGLTFEQVTQILKKELNSPALKNYNVKTNERQRTIILQKLTHVLQLLYELRCVEAIFCIVSVVTTQLISRIYPEELNAQLNEALTGEGPWIIEAGRINLEEGLARKSSVAKQFFKDGKVIYEGYVPFFQKCDYLFKEMSQVKRNTFYTVEQLEQIVKIQLKLDSGSYSDLRAAALKLGKPVNAMKLIDAGGNNYATYRNVQKQALQSKQAFVPYLGILRRDLVFTMDGPENYADKNKMFINFMKASVLYDYVVSYLSHQANFLAVGLDNTDVYLSQNAVARRIANGEDPFLQFLRGFASGPADTIDMWAISEFVKPRKPK